VPAEVCDETAVVGKEVREIEELICNPEPAD
jgi:hypothetical protein